MIGYAVMAETLAGKTVTLRGGFLSRESAEDHPVKLSAWKRVWVAKVEIAPPIVATLPPLPWGYESSVAASANGSFHLYLTDAEGRKIAAIWGRGDAKRLTAEHILSAVNRPSGET